MKAFALACLFCWCLWPSEAQAQVSLQDTADEWQVGHIKLSIAGPAIGALYTIFSWPGLMLNAGAAYEFTLSPKRSICLAANGTYFRQQFWWWGVQNTEDVFSTQESLTFSGQYRFYFRDAWIEGFYAAPSMAATKSFWRTPDFVWNPIGGANRIGWFTSNTIAFGAGGTIGYQYVTNGISMDISLGLHVGPQWTTWVSEEEEQHSSFVGVIPTGSFSIGKLFFHNTTR